MVAIADASVQEAEVMESSGGVIYEVKFHITDMVVNISGLNPTDKRVMTGIVVRTDGAVVAKLDRELSSDERWRINTRIHSAIDVSKREHSLTVSTFGSHITFNFTKGIASTSPGPIPVPYIKNVQITNGTIDGEPSAVAEVTVANPSKQTYPTKLMVHTTETHGSFYPAAVPPGETRTITVELLDERGSKVAGEARLYTEGLNKQEGAMDQVEFVGQAGAGTDHWNVSYRPVRPPWEDDSYRYRNSSVSGNGGVLPGASDTTLLYVAVGVLVLLWVVRKVR